MQDDCCWNCGSTGERLRSKRTGIVYCAECGAATDGLGAVTDFSVLDVEPVGSGGAACAGTPGRPHRLLAGVK